MANFPSFGVLGTIPAEAGTVAETAGAAACGSPADPSLPGTGVGISSIDVIGLASV
jgi:hypothetical protein